MKKKRKPGEVSMGLHRVQVPEGAEVVTIEYFQCSDGQTHQLDGDSGEATERMADGTLRRKCPRFANTPWTNTELFRYAHPIRPETAASVHQSLESGDAAGLRRYGDGQKNLLAKLLGL